jgi:hypothetical protein
MGETTAGRAEPGRRRKDVSGAEGYREEAAELRRRAASAQIEQIRQNFLDIADQYEQLADAIDRHV